MLTSWALGTLLYLVELLDFSHISALLNFRCNNILGVITFLRIASSPELETSSNPLNHVRGIKSFHLSYRGLKSKPMVPRY